MMVARIASSLELPRSTVARVLQRRGLNRLISLEPQERGCSRACSADER